MVHSILGFEAEGVLLGHGPAVVTVHSHCNFSGNFCLGSHGLVLPCRPPRPRLDRSGLGRVLLCICAK